MIGPYLLGRLVFHLFSFERSLHSDYSEESIGLLLLSVNHRRKHSLETGNLGIQAPLS